MPAGTQPGREFVLRGRGVPAAPGAWPRRPAGDRPGRGADQAHAPRRRAAAAVRRGARRGGRRARAGPVLADQVGVLVNDELRRLRSSRLRRRRRRAGARPTMPRTTSLRVLRVCERRAGHRHRRARTVAACHIADGTLARDRRRGRRSRRDPSRSTIAFAVPKEDRPEWIVQKLTELGVDRIVFLHAERSVVRWDGERAERHLARLAAGRAARLRCSARRVWLPRSPVRSRRPTCFPGPWLPSPAGSR